MILGVDIEACSAADIDDGAAPYAEHPSTRVWCVVFSLSSGRGDNRIHRWCPWLPGPRELPSWVTEHIAAGRPMLAHNVAFESSIWRHILTPRLGWPEPRSGQWIDSLLHAAQLNLPLNLGKLGAAIGAAVLKDDEGHDLMISLSKAKEPTGGLEGWIYPRWTDAMLERLTLYCERDVLSMIDCYWKMEQPLITEKAMIRLDRVINERGVQIDLPLAAKMAVMAKAREEEIGATLWNATHDLLGAINVPALTDWVKQQGVELPKVVRKKDDGTFHATESLDRASISEILARPQTPPLVRQVLDARVETGRVTSLAKTVRVPVAVNADGRLRFSLRYCRALTGRWSSEILQLHNLAKPTKPFKKVANEFSDAVKLGNLRMASQYFAVLEGLSYMLRSLVIARPGCLLVGGDFASIEARGVAWVAGQLDKLEVFRRYDEAVARGEDTTELDPYMIAARKAGTDNRDIGKVAELSLGYQMGAVKFHDRADGKLTTIQARAVQRGWRKNNPKIVQFWADIQEAFGDAMDHRGTPVFVGDHITVIADKECLRIVLPSGRAICYWRPHRKMVKKKVDTIDEKTGAIVTTEFDSNELRFYTPGKQGMEVESTYGGKLTENIVQALCRDLLRDALLRLDALGYKIVLHVHDSIAAEIAQDSPSVLTVMQRDFCSRMAEQPLWAPGFPIAVEGYTSRHFKG